MARLSWTAYWTMTRDGMSTTGSADQSAELHPCARPALAMASGDPCPRRSPVGGRLLKQQAGGQTVIGSAIVQVQTLAPLLNDDPASGPGWQGPFDRLISDGGQLLLGDVPPLRAVHTPGHTRPA